jgi:hypothetical protein
LARLFSVYVCLRSLLKERRDLALENLALRQQLVVLKPSYEDDLSIDKDAPDTGQYN